MASSTIIRAKTSFTFTNSQGTPISVREGETFHKDSARLEGLSDEARNGSFEPFTPDYDLEQATAAPGEKRRSPRRKKDEDTKEQATAAPGDSETSAGEGQGSKSDDSKTKE